MAASTPRLYSGVGGNAEVAGLCPHCQSAKNLARVKGGDLVEVSYTQALAINLDKPATT
jgi:glutaredoxin